MRFTTEDTSPHGPEGTREPSLTSLLLIALWCDLLCVEKKAHPFPGKLNLDQAGEVRRLRARGHSLAEIAERFGVAKSSISAVIHYHAHVPEGVLRVAVPVFERALLAEIAEDGGVPAEQLAADLLVEMLRSRAW